MNKNLMKVLKINTMFLALSSYMCVAKAETEYPKVYYEDVVNTGKDTGFSKKNKIKKGDPHYGWELGKFSLTGFSSTRKDKNGNWILLKNVGDKITLYFNLSQNINKLDGNKNLLISEDKNGYDNEFNIKQTNFGKGALIIRKIDSTGNKNKPKLYTNYLKGVKVGANTKVEVFEEGDYEVALDYEVMEDGVAFFNDFNNYRIRFNFSVRNGNCMVFPFDVKTKSELVNTAITENGFYLDIANSKYLDLNIKKEILKKGANGLTEDTRFNRPAKPGEKFTEEGIYTITAKNEYTNEQTIKKIYVGKNNLLKAHVQTGYSISDLKNMTKLGATIDNDGNISDIPKEYLATDDSTSVVPVKTLKMKKLKKAIPIIIVAMIAIIFLIYKIVDHVKIVKLAKKIEKEKNDEALEKQNDIKEVKEENGEKEKEVKETKEEKIKEDSKEKSKPKKSKKSTKSKGDDLDD